MLASDILTDVREFLNDEDKDRYSDTYLIGLLNEGLLDLSARLRLFKSEASIPFIKGQSVYSLPLDFIEFSDISVNGELPIDFASKEEIAAKYGDSWRKKTTENAPSNIIYNKQTFYQFRVFPTPVGDNIYDLFEIDEFGIASDVDDIESVDSFGIFPTLEDELNTILFDPVQVNNDLDNISNQVVFLAGQVSQYAQSISANAVAIQQVYGIAASAETTAQGAQLAASTAVTTVNDLAIDVSSLTDDLGAVTTTLASLASQVTTIEASVSTAQSSADAAQADADAAGLAASAAQATANSAVSIANTATARLNNTNGSNLSIESLASNVSTLSSQVTSATNTANSANTTAGQAVNTANSAVTTANNVKTRIDNIGGGAGPSIESLAATVTSLSASIATANANASSAVTVANSASATASSVNTGLNNLTTTVNAQGSSLTTVTATVASHTATISTHSSAIAALESGMASWEVVTNVNDLTNGFGIYNNGTYEEVVFRTNNFKVYPNSGILNPFSFAIESGKVVIPNAMITNIIQSDNFVTGVQGWQINKATASAEFYSVTARGNIQATSLNAATGTFSGTLTAAAINAVNTINIADQSIVIDTSYFNISSITLGTNISVATKSISMINATAASTVDIAFTAEIAETFNSNPVAGFSTLTVVMQLYRDGTLIFSKTQDRTVWQTNDVSYALQTGVNLEYVDQPGAGTFNYQILITTSGTTNYTVPAASYRLLKLSGGKK